jgi:hypothetical protein
VRFSWKNALHEGNLFMRDIMYAFEREALGIESLGEIRGGVTLTGNVDVDGDPSLTWWLTSFYSPDIWETWRVGLVRESLCIAASSPVSLPSPIEFEFPMDAGQPPDLPDILPRRLIVCPAVVKGRAFGFVVRNPGAAAGDHLANPSPHLQVVAPTNLIAGLGLQAGETIALRVLPAHAFRPERRPER